MGFQERFYDDQLEQSPPCSHGDNGNCTGKQEWQTIDGG
jgi:hypothetical protein